MNTSAHLSGSMSNADVEAVFTSKLQTAFQSQKHDSFMDFAAVFHATTCTNIFRPSRQQCSSPPLGLARRDWSTVVLSACTGCRLPAHLLACVWHFSSEVFIANAVSTQLEHIFQVLKVSKGCSNLSDFTAFQECEFGASMAHSQSVKGWMRGASPLVQARG